MSQDSLVTYLLGICGILFAGNIYFIKFQIEEVREIKKVILDFLLIKQRVESIEHRIEQFSDLKDRVRDLEFLIKTKGE